MTPQHGLGGGGGGFGRNSNIGLKYWHGIRSVTKVDNIDLISQVMKLVAIMAKSTNLYPRQIGLF